MALDVDPDTAFSSPARTTHAHGRGRRAGSKQALLLGEVLALRAQARADLGKGAGRTGGRASASHPEAAERPSWPRTLHERMSSSQAWADRALPSSIALAATPHVLGQGR